MQQSLIRRTFGTLRRLTDLPALRHIPLSDAVCGGIVCTAPAVLAAYLHNPLFSWSAIAAFWSYISIPGGKFSIRCLSVLAFGLAGAIASGLGAWTVAYPLLVIGLAALIGFGGAYAQAAGAHIGFPALLVATAFAVSTAFPGKDFAHGVTYATYFLYGNLWASGFALFLWRNQKHRPATRALTSCFVELSTLARSLSGYKEHTYQRGFEHAFSRARVNVRKYLDNARQQIDALPNHNTRTQSLLRLLSSAQELFSTLIALESLTSQGQNSNLPRAVRNIAAQMSTRIAAATQSLALCCRSDTRFRQKELKGDLQQLDSGMARLRMYLKNTSDLSFKVDTLCSLLERIRGSLQLGYELVSHVPSTVHDILPGLETPSVLSPWKSIKDNFTPKSHFFLHGLRVGLAAVISVGLVKTWSLDHGYWMTITAFLIMQPQFSGTLKTSLERVGGTLLGGLIAAALGLFVHSPILLAALILPISIGTLAGRSVSYMAFTLFLTPHFILVAQLGQPTGSELDLTWLRVFNSFAGALLAIGISLLVYPRWERDHLRAKLAGGIEASVNYLCRILQNDQQAADARRQACASVDQIDSLLERLRREPNVDHRKMSGAIAIVAGLRDLVGATTLLAISAKPITVQSDVELRAGFSQWASQEMNRSAALLRGVPPEEEVFESDIVTAKPTCELLCHVIERFSASVALIGLLADRVGRPS